MKDCIQLQHKIWDLADKGNISFLEGEKKMEVNIPGP